MHNVEMAFIFRPRVYDDRPRVFSGTDNPGIRALEGGIAGIITKNYANGLAYGTQLTVCGVLHAYQPNRSLSDLYDQFDLHRGILWQGSYADCRTRVRASLAEYLPDEIRCPVNHRGLCLLYTSDAADE